MEAILAAPGCRVDGFLAAGHVCTVMGLEEYRPLAARYRVPIVVTGFEPLDLLQGIHMCVRQLEEGRAEVENQYARSVARRRATQPARAMIREVFEVVPRSWRGIGAIPASGLACARRTPTSTPSARFEVDGIGGREDPRVPERARAAGPVKPPDCPAFGTRCTPETPLGATMVSAEGACAAYYRYRRFDQHATRRLRSALSDRRSAATRTVQLAHGGGGRLMRELIEQLVPAGVRRTRALRDAPRQRRAVRSAARGSRSRPTPTSSSRASSPAATSGRSPSTAP